MSEIEELICRAQGGDDMAMNEVIGKNSYLAKSIARKYYLIGGEIEDLVQWGMYGLFKAIASFNLNSGASFKTYASKIIKNEIVSEIKKAYSHKGEVLLETDFADMSEFSAGDTPERGVLDDEEYEGLFESLLKNLSVLEKSVIKSYLEGYSYKEIAKSLGKTPKSIDSALNKAKIKIKKNYLQSKEGK